MANAAIEATGLTKRYGEVEAIRGLGLRVERGWLYGLLGPNGAGKTTTARILTGLTRPSSGEAVVLGRRVPDRRLRGRIGYMPQDVALYGDLTVRQNIRLFGELHNMSRADMAVREAELLELIGLVAWRNTPLSDLGWGMKRRVSLAVSLIHQPELLVLDGPTVGVDPELREAFWGYFQRLRTNGVTVLITSHYLDEASHCGRVGLMREGSLLAEGTPEEIRRKAGAATLEEAYLALARKEATPA
jgi:ABC-2 type transport system ATP-binding protein